MNTPFFVRFLFIMKDAIVHGNRLIMMCDGRVILDIKGEEKAKLTVEDLLQSIMRKSIPFPSLRSAFFPLPCR